MLRRAARLVLVGTTGTVALAAGVLTALTLTPTGRGLLARAVEEALDRRVLGEVTIGAIGGSFVRDLAFRGLEIRDTSGGLLLKVPSARVTYRLPDLLRGAIILRRVELEQPEVRLVKYRSGRMNYEEVLRLGGGTAGGPPPIVQFLDVNVTEGRLQLELPWQPAVTTAAARDSARRAQLAAHPGRRIEPGRDGLVQVTTFDSLTARLPYVLASSPSRKPVTVRLDSLAVRVSDPGVRVTDATGQVELRGDTLAFQFQRVALPNTEAIGGGRVLWPQDTILYDFTFNAPRVDLADLRWISPGFPAMRGRARVTATSESGTRTAYDVRDLVLVAGRERLDGNLVAVTDQRRGLGVRRLRMTLTAVDLAKAKPYVPALPFTGTLDGTLDADGFLDDLAVTLDWRYADAAVRGRPVTTLAGEGRVRLLASGLRFEPFTVRDADVDLATVRRLVPAIALQGRLRGDGELRGSLERAVFEGALEHEDGELPVSRASGHFGIDVRGREPVVDVDAELAPLVFDGVRRSYPAIRLQGAVDGHVRLDGTLARLRVDTDLRGDLGAVRARGIFGLDRPSFSGDSVIVTAERLDLAMLDPAWPRSAVTGRLRAAGTADSGAVPDGDLVLEIGSSRLGPIAADTGLLRTRVRDGLLQLDTLDVRWRGAVLAAGGFVGWRSPADGRITGVLAADSLAGFGSLLDSIAGPAADTTAMARTPLGGRALLTFAASGTLDSLEARADFEAADLRWRLWRNDRLTGAATWRGGSMAALAVGVRADSIRNGGQVFRELAADLQGPRDLLAWSGRVRIGDAAGLDARGRWWTRLAPQIVSVDTLSAGLPSRAWSLESPVAVTLNDEAQAITPIALRTADGSGRADVVGRIPGRGEGGLSLAILGVDLKDVFTFLQRDTTGVGGQLSLTGELAGTAAAPTLEGAMAVEGLRIEEAKLPLVQGAVHYARRRLGADLRLWRTGEPVLAVEADLPISLAWRDVGDRLPPGEPLRFRAKGDSVDLAILEAVSNTVREVQGTLAVDVRADGTWDAPRLSGFATVRDGRMTVRPVGVTYTNMRGRLELDGDSLALRGVRLEGSEAGRLDASGVVRFPGRRSPQLDVTLDADRFVALDVPGFLTFTGTGRVTLTGPVFGATLRGRATATDTQLWFADLISKRVINIDDPALAEFIAQDTVARVKLRAGLSTRFFEALNVEDFALTVGDEVRLRSNEADILMSGDLVVNKRRRTYRFDGTMRAERGTYNLLLGGIFNRQFTVERGTVRYFGTTDLNAELDIEARHIVRAARGGEVPVIARIGGTLYAPKVRLESADAQLSEADIASYLLTGYAAGDVTTGNTNYGSIVSGGLLNTFVGSAIGNFGLPAGSLLEVRLATTTGANDAAPSLNQINAGFQIAPRTFLLLNYGFCRTQLANANVGVSLQYRFSRAFRFQTSVEPRQQFCSQGPAATAAVGRQFGADLLFEKEF